MVIYDNICQGHFLSRPNRFVAQVEIRGQTETVHVKNTGRCRELLVAGTEVWCQEWDKPGRKTKFDLYAVRKGERIINMDSQAPNKAAKDWLLAGGLGDVSGLRAEVPHGNSRFDFAFQKDGRQCYLEVKGVTLEEDNVVRFPDAPTLRGTKHLRGLARAVLEGNGAYVLFVIQMERVKYLEPNWRTDPDFAQALAEARRAGVRVLAVDCRVTESTMELMNFIPVHLE